MIHATNILALFQKLGLWEIIIILAAILLLFGGKRLPGLARSLARGIKSFKKEMKGAGDEFKNAMDMEDDPAPKSPDTSKDNSSDS